MPESTPSPAPSPPAAPDDQGLSLEELGEAYARLLSGGSDPYPETQESDPALDDESGDITPARDEPAPCEISPRSILEAMLFVGHPHNEPLTARQVAALMRGVRAAEIDDLVAELNALYESEDRAYVINSSGPGYRLELRGEMTPLLETFYGKVREARLSQAAIEILSVVAYHQPLTRPQIDEFRGKPSGAVLTQLVRRELLRVDRGDARPRVAHYRTTDRFLDLFGLESLDDLPRSQESER